VWCVVALRAAGYGDADVIGFVTERSGCAEPVTVDLTGEQLSRRSPSLTLPTTGRACANRRLRAGEPIH
jgi:hypothetical protein